jgi:hypothetical protein
LHELQATLDMTQAGAALSAGAGQPLPLPGMTAADEHVAAESPTGDPSSQNANEALVSPDAATPSVPTDELSESSPETPTSTGSPSW